MIATLRLALILILLPLIAVADIMGTATVTDGDSIKINGERIRLHGIDAPEKKQMCKRGGQTWACGEAATEALRGIVEGRHAVTCKEIDRDRYGRIVGKCMADYVPVSAAMVLLATFETEMSFILTDVQESIRARSERAFSHLQRSIVADREFREKWNAAFDEGEVACEKLGAVHLLLHGIWAFKVDAAGARTDLVFQEPAGDLTDKQRYVDGFVLTEWKKVADDADAESRFEEARVQAKRYAQGALAGSELTSYRYAVVVSRRRVSLPEDLSADGVVYRHINIAVDPQTPSRG